MTLCIKLTSPIRYRRVTRWPWNITAVGWPEKRGVIGRTNARHIKQTRIYLPMPNLIVSPLLLATGTGRRLAERNAPIFLRVQKKKRGKKEKMGRSPNGGYIGCVDFNSSMNHIFPLI